MTRIEHHQGPQEEISLIAGFDRSCGIERNKRRTKNGVAKTASRLPALRCRHSPTTGFAYIGLAMLLVVIAAG